MYAVIVHVRIAPGQTEASRTELKTQVIPRIRQAPGFVRGYWAAKPDGVHGESMVVFSTKHDAEQAVAMVRNSPPPHGVTIESIEACEVIAEA